MPTRPSDLPDWATGGAAVIVQPPAPSRATGWISPLKPPDSWMNWLFNTIYLWTQFFSETVAFYDDLLEAISGLSVGDTCTVFESDATLGPGVEEIEKDTGMTATTSTTGDIDTCGDLVVFGAADNDPKGVNRALDEAQSGGTPIAEYTRSEGIGNARNTLHVRTNGVLTIVVYQDTVTSKNWVEGFNALTAASLWTHDNDTDQVDDVVLINNTVVIIHPRTSGVGDTVANRNVHALNATTGVVLWSYDHSALAFASGSICSNGRQVFIAGSATGYASLANLRALRLSDGFDVAGEGSTGTDLSGLAWDTIITDNVTIACAACDRRMLYLGKNSAAANQIEARGISNGELVWSVAHPDSTMSCRSIIVDQDYVIVTMTDSSSPREGFVEAYDRKTGALVWRYAASDKTATHTGCVAAVSDGQKVFCMAEDESLIWQITRGNIPHPFRRVNPATFNDGYRNLKLQPEPF